MSATSNNIAASKIRKKFTLVATDSMPQEHGLNGDAEPNERTNLISRHFSTGSGTPYYEHHNPMIRYPSTILHTTWQVLKTNYVNVLLVFVPIGILSGILNWSPVAQFCLNFVAIVPLASLLAFATEELAVPLGQTLGGLLNATFGNAVELIVSISSLTCNLVLHHPHAVTH